MSTRSITLTILVSAFLAFWLFGMATGLASGACRKGLSSLDRTSRACAVSHFGFVMLTPLKHREKTGVGPLYAGYGVTSFARGDVEAAKEWFQRALALGQKDNGRVTLKNGIELPITLAETIQRIHHRSVPRGARMLWWNVVTQQRPDLAKQLHSAATGAGS